MTRSLLLALLRIDAGENHVLIPESTWLMEMGYIADDGCEVYTTAFGDVAINTACSSAAAVQRVTLDDDDVLGHLTDFDDLNEGVDGQLRKEIECLTPSTNLEI
jgi:hypothetical protein